MELAAKAAALGVCAALMALLLKKSNAELALCLGLGAAAAILLAALGLAEDILDAAERAGVTPVTGVPWGHGIGVASQEAPWIAPGDAPGLKEGMVLVLTPHVQGPGGTILYSRDTVLLDFNGCKILGWYKDWREPYVASDSYYSGGG